MSTDAILSPQSLPRTGYRPVHRGAEHAFFGGMAILLCALVFIGFSPTYFRAGVFRAPLPSPILHVHGALFSLWMLLYLVQSTLISARRVAWHRSLGAIAYCLPPLMVVLGVVAAVEALHRGVVIGTLDPAVSMAIPLLSMPCFALVIFASWRARRRSDAHKRLVVLATITLVGAAFGRLHWREVSIPPAAGVSIGIAFLLLCMVAYDLFSLHRVHRSTLWAAPLILAVQVVSVPIGMTPVWHSFAAMIDRTVGPLI